MSKALVLLRHLPERLRVRQATQFAFYLTLLITAAMLATRLLTLSELPSSIDWRLLLLLGSFMLISEGLKLAGFMDWIAGAMVRNARGIGGLYFGLLMSAFVLATLITNDAALFAVIPLTIAFAQRIRLNLRRLVIYEIIAVNLGSALTPWGNPQNLFIYRYYNLSPGMFFQQSYPFVLISLAALYILVAITLARGGRGKLALPSQEMSRPEASRGEITILVVLFLLLILSALHLIPALVSAGLLVLYMGVKQRDSFRRVDWWLLGTFLLLFPTMGGLGGALARALGNEFGGPMSVYGAGVGISQVISNVPATMLLSHATTDWRSLFYGVNLGGLGTVVASFANLIGLSLYLKGVRDDNWRAFLGESLVWNVGLLVVLGGLFILLVRA